MGPALKFQRDGVIAITGADMQPKPGDLYRFKSISVDEAQTLRKNLNAVCSASSIA